MPKHNVALLSHEQIDQAFPLIQASCPEVELQGWRRFARHRLGLQPGFGTGILAVCNAQDCIVGIGAFQLSHDLLHGPVLLADRFCALEIMDPAGVARALEAAIEKVARRHGCSAVHTTVAPAGSHGHEGWLSSVLYERGHHVEGLQMCRLIPPT